MFQKGDYLYPNLISGIMRQSMCQKSEYLYPKLIPGINEKMYASKK